MPKGRKRRSKNKSTAVVAVGTGRQLVPISPATQSGKRPNTSRRRAGRRSNTPRRGLNMLSPAGLAFLKCATAPPDFQADPGKGIPDTYEGRILPLKHASTTSMEFSKGRDTYLVFPPIPGVMMLSSVVNVGTAPNSFTATYHNDAMTKGFSEFRFASTCVGIYPTCNFSEFGGSITVYKTMIAMGSRPLDSIMNIQRTSSGSITSSTSGRVDIPIMTGADFGPISPSNNFSAPFIDGCYTQAFNIAPNFEFVQAGAYLEVANYVRQSTNDRVPNMTGTEKLFSFAGAPVAGFGNLETIIIKITTPNSASNSAIIKSWQCLEVVPDTTTPMYKFLNNSPPLDMVALAIYRRLANELPIAVIAKMNAGTWDRISQMIVNMLKAGSYIPGPMGVVSGGLSMAMAGIRDLTI